MRYPSSEKLEIIRLVEQSHLPVRRTLATLGILPMTFYRWYALLQPGGPEALEDKPSRPRRVGKHAVSTAEELLAGARRLVGFELRQKLHQAFDAKGRERGHLDVVVDIADVEAAVFRLHVEGDLFQQGFVFIEHLRHLGDGEDMAWCRHIQAALAMARRPAQFQGSSSSMRLAGCSAMRARTSAS